MTDTNKRLLFTLFNEEDTTELKKLTAEERQVLANTYQTKIQQLKKQIHQITLEKDGINNRHELKFWLITVLSSFQVPPKIKYQRFTEILEKNLHSKYAEQFILFACYKTPKSIAKVLLSNAKLFEHFFKNNAPRINAWFTFKFSGKNENGALALEQYLFMNRDQLWESLTWQGRRDVPPCVAIQKKNMLMELDLVSTLNMLSESKIKPSFWESDFFKSSLMSGEFLELDYQYFAEAIVGVLETGNKEDKRIILDAIQNYIDEEEYKELAQKLLHLVDEKDLLYFVYKLQSRNDSYSSMDGLLNAVYLCETKWHTLDDLLVVNAILNYGKQIVKIFTEEENSFKLQLDNWIQENASWNSPEKILQDISGHWAFRLIKEQKELKEMSIYECFLIMYRLYRYLDDEGYFEEIMQKEKLTFESQTVKTKKNRGESKRRKKAKEVEQFMGFKFQEPEKFTLAAEKEKEWKMTTVHPLPDAVIYISHYFLYKFLNKQQ